MDITEKMDKTEKCTVIKYFFLKEMCCKDIHGDMLNTLGENVPSCSVVKSWIAEFKRGRISTADEPRLWTIFKKYCEQRK